MGRVETKFKQTEVGLIPEDWEVKELGELTSLMTNGFVGNVKSQYTESDSGVIYIQGYNVEENSFNFNGIKKVTIEFHKLHLKSCLQEHDLLTIQTGDVGLTTIVPKALVGANCHALIISRFKKGTTNPKYFSLYLNSSNGRSRLKEIETGTTMKHINVGDMLHFIVPVPKKNEQTAIANALSDVDGYIESLEKLIAKKQKIKQGAMQQLLKPKPHWEVKKLGEIAEILDNLRVPLNDNQRLKMKGDIPYCGANGIVDYVDDYVIDDDIILMAEDGGYFDEYKTRPIAYRMLGKAWVNNHAHILKAKISTDQGYLFYSLVHKNILDFINGGTRAKLNKGDLINIEISLPENKTEQEEIAKILSYIDSEITTLNKKLTKAKDLKQGMMQQLLTGKIRLI